MACISHSHAMLLLPFLFLRGLMDGDESEQVSFLLLPFGSIRYDRSLMKVQPKGIKHFLMEFLLLSRDCIPEQSSVCMCRCCFVFWSCHIAGWAVTHCYIACGFG